MSTSLASDSFGSYKLLDPLGEGGMGVVYVAEHQTLGKRVALKVLRPELDDEEMSARFVAEARAAAQIGHEHIVEVTDFGKSAAGRSFFVMELLEGQSLAELLAAEGPLCMRRALKIAAQVASALAASHDAGIVHRDLKPDNVFLICRGGDPDYVKVLDFGLAKPLQASQERLHRTKTGSTLGTPYYMAPEQWLSKPIDGRTDVYALGVLLYQMITGELPFQGESWGALCLEHTTTPFPSASERRDDVPASLVQALAKATQKALADRHDSVDELAEALAQVAAELGDDESVAQQTPDGAEAGRATRAADPALAATEPSTRSELLEATLVSARDELPLPAAKATKTGRTTLVAVALVAIVAVVAVAIGLSSEATPPAPSSATASAPSTQATTMTAAASGTAAQSSSTSAAIASATTATSSSRVIRKPSAWPKPKKDDDDGWVVPK